MRRLLSIITYFSFILCFNSSILANPATSPEFEGSSKKPGLKKNCYNLVLYINPRCPYCHKVTDYLKEQGNRVIPTKSTSDPGVREELIRIGGKGQIPCLVINGKALYESDAIIDWLRNHPSITNCK